MRKKRSLFLGLGMVILAALMACGRSGSPQAGTSNPNESVTPTRTSSVTASEPTVTPTLTRSPITTSTPYPTPAEPITADNVQRLRLLALWGRGTLNAVAWSSDGRRVALGSSLGVTLYDPNTLEQVAFWPTEAAVFKVAFSSDGNLLAAGLSNGSVQIWRVSDGHPLHLFHWGYWGKLSMAFSPDGKMAAMGGGSGFFRGHPAGYDVEVAQVSDGKILASLQMGEAAPAAEDIALSPDGRFVAAAFEYEGVALWRISDETLVRTLAWGAGDEAAKSVAFSPDGSLLAVGTGDGTVQLWQVADGSLQNMLKGHTDAVNHLAFSSDGRLLASASADKTARVWQVGDGKALRTLEANGAVSAVAFSPDGSLLATVAGGTTMQLWQVADGQALGRAETIGPVNTLAVSADGRLVAAGSAAGMVRVWQTDDGKVLHTFKDLGVAVDNVALVSNGSLLAAALADGTVRVWRVADGQPEITLKPENADSVDFVAFSPDGNLMAAVVCVQRDDDGDCIRKPVKLWQISNGQMVGTLDFMEQEEMRYGVTAMAFSPDGTALGVVMGNIAYLLRVDDGKVLRKVECDCWPYAIYTSAFSPDLRFAALSSWELPAAESDSVVLDMEQGQMASLVHFFSPTSEPSGLAFSPDGKLLARGFEDGEVELWPVSGGEKPLYTFTGAAGSVNSMVFSPDARWLVVGSDDGTVRLWGVGP